MLKSQIKVAVSSCWTCSFHGKINQMFQSVNYKLTSYAVWQFIDCILCSFKPVRSADCLAVTMTSPQKAYQKPEGLLTFTVFLPFHYFRSIPPRGLLVIPLTLSWFAMKYRGGVNFPSEAQQPPGSNELDKWEGQDPPCKSPHLLIIRLS